MKEDVTVDKVPIPHCPPALAEVNLLHPKVPAESKPTNTISFVKIAARLFELTGYSLKFKARFRVIAPSFLIALISIGWCLCMRMLANALDSRKTCELI